MNSTHSLTPRTMWGIIVRRAGFSPMPMTVPPPPPTTRFARPLENSFRVNSWLANFSGCTSNGLIATGPKRILLVARAASMKHMKGSRAAK